MASLERVKGANVGWKQFVTDAGAPALLRVQGWGGGSQWKMHTAFGSTRISGCAGGQQWKLWITPIAPPP